MTFTERQTALHYPLWLRALAAMLVLVPVGAAWLVWVENPVAADDTFSNLAPWVLLGLWLAGTYQIFLVELYYDDKGITHVSPMGGIIRIEWSEVVGLAYVRGFEGYVLEAEDGRRIWFNDLRMGIPDFAAAIQQRLPRRAQGGR